MIPVSLALINLFIFVLYSLAKQVDLLLFLTGIILPSVALNYCWAHKIQVFRQMAGGKIGVKFIKIIAPSTIF